MWKWFRWVLLSILILIIGLGIGLYYNYFIRIKMDSDLVTKAESALSSGVTLEDAKDDFVIMGSNKEELNAENNPSPYKLDYLDIKSVALGSDDKYLYCKITFYGTIPKSQDKVDGDPIQAIGAKAEMVDDQGKEFAILVSDFGYQPVIGLPSFNTYYFYGPTGIQEPESARYSHQDHDSKVYGGGGFDYLMGAFPLDKLGLKTGQTINIRFPMEVKSGKYTHAAVDVAGGSGKDPALISWKLGTNQYEIIDKPVESSSDKKDDIK